MKSLAKTINSDKNMTAKKTTPEQFVKEWLPEYEKRLRNWQEDAEAAGSAFSVDYNWFCKTYFHEAIEAFARHVWDQACEKQRGICANWATDSSGSDVLHAPAPEFKLTEKE